MWKLIAAGDIVSIWSGRRELRCEIIACDERGLSVDPLRDDSTPPISLPLRAGDGVVIRLSDGRFRPATIIRPGAPLLIGPVPNADHADASGTTTCTCPGCWRPDVEAIPPSPIEIDEGVVWGYDCDECGHAWTNLDYERYLRWLEKPARPAAPSDSGPPRLQAESSLP